MNLRVATFRFDATPPKGRPLCGGWIRPAEEADDPLEEAGAAYGDGGPWCIPVREAYAQGGCGADAAILRPARGRGLD